MNVEFDFESEYSTLSNDLILVENMSKMEQMGFTNKKLNFFKLSIYKWDLEEAIRCYHTDSYCWDYCVFGECKNKQQCESSYLTHDDKMKLFEKIDNKENTRADYKYMEYLCEYLISFIPKYFNNSNQLKFLLMLVVHV